MSISDTTSGDAERELRSLAGRAYASATDTCGLATTVLRRTRQRRRRLVIARSSLVGAALVGSVAAVSVGGGPYYEYRQPSAVMAPAVPTGTSVVVNRELDPQRMDVVQLELRVDGADVEGLLRVIGVAGDTVACAPAGAGPCSVTVNGVSIQDDYVGGLPSSPFAEFAVPSGALFVLGDARDVAVDSRSVGAVDVDDINGVVVAVTDAMGTTRAVAGAPRHPVPDGYQVDPEGPVPPAPSSP